MAAPCVVVDLEADEPAPPTATAAEPYTSGQEGDDDDRCCVCGESEADEDDPLIFCEGCDMAVHKVSTRLRGTSRTCQRPAALGSTFPVPHVAPAGLPRDQGDSR